MNATEKNSNARSKGRHYEQIALEYLISLDFEFIARNFHSKYGEIDLIMKKDSVLHFVEVKSSSYMNPLLNITTEKIQRLIKTIHIFLEHQKISCDFCIDAISIYNDKINFIENITISL